MAAGQNKIYIAKDGEIYMVNKEMSICMIMHQMKMNLQTAQKCTSRVEIFFMAGKH